MRGEGEWRRRRGEHESLVMDAHSHNQVCGRNSVCDVCYKFPNPTAHRTHTVGLLQTNKCLAHQSRQTHTHTPGGLLPLGSTSVVVNEILSTMGCAPALPPVSV